MLIFSHELTGGIFYSWNKLCFEELWRNVLLGGELQIGKKQTNKQTNKMLKSLRVAPMWNLGVCL